MEPNLILALSFVGFGIQQFVQMVADPLVSLMLSRAPRSAPTLPGAPPAALPVPQAKPLSPLQPPPADAPPPADGGDLVPPLAGPPALGTAPAIPAPPQLIMGSISDMDAKKALLGLIAFLLGWMIVGASDEKLLVLQALKFTGFGGWDQFVSALTVAATTEGANSILKTFQYGKDFLKARTSPDVAHNSPVPQQPAGRR